MLVYSLGTLDEAACKEVRAHLARGCATCAGYLAEAEETLAHLPFVLDPVAPPEATKHQLVARLRAGQADAKVELKESGRVGTRSFVRPAPSVRQLIWSAVGGATVASLLIYAVLPSSRDLQHRLAVAEGTIDENQSQIRRLQGQLHFANQTLSVVHQPRLEVTQLATTSRQPNASGYLVWDSAQRQLHVYAMGVAPAAEHELLRIWLSTDDGRTISGGTMVLDQSGQGCAIVDVPDRVTPVSVFLTPEGDEPNPNTVLLQGNVK
jgi:hypothetical protein